MGPLREKGREGKGKGEAGIALRFLIFDIITGLKLTLSRIKDLAHGETVCCVYVMRHNNKANKVYRLQV